MVVWKTISTLALVAALASLATAVIPSSDGTISACYHKKKGLLRVVDAGVPCKKNELPLAWSQQGPQGAQGLPGADGPAGSPDTPVDVLAKLAQVDGTGSGLDADTLGGARIVKIDYRVPIDDVGTIVFDGGGLRIAAACPNGNDLDVIVRTTKDDAQVQVTQNIGGTATSVNITDLDTDLGQVIAMDAASHAWFSYAAPDGVSVHGILKTEEFPAGGLGDPALRCSVVGVAIVSG